MNATTSANPTTSAQTATVPSIRLLQLDPAAIGRIAGSVNLFRGDVLLPLELLSLTSRGGLEVKVAVAYQSNIFHNVNTWNVEAPTGILGLGWSMSYDAIIADHGDSISPFDTTFYLVDSNGGQTRLYLKTRTATEWIFEMESYRFWDIRFFPAESVWQIRTESGTVKRYGENANARELGVLWGGAKGNWTDASVQAGQSRFDTGWGLSSIQNLFGDKLQFEYENVNLTIGAAAGNLPYTRASYLAAIIDPSGRRVTFSYGEKVYTETIREYENPHIDAADRKLVAYQDRYQTRFLKSITVSDETGPSAVTYMSLRFAYSLAKVSQAVGEARYLYKRYLRSINVVDRDGAVQPGLTFNYSGVDTTPTSANPGALATVTYPEGGQTLYEYGVKQLPGTALRRELKQSDTGAGVPRIWFGSDYTVISRYDDRNGRLLTINVYDWNGRWIGSQPLKVNLPGTLDLNTLSVQPRGDWFLLSGRTSGQASGPAIFAYALNRKFGRFGDWEVTQLQMPSLALSTEYAIVAGSEFVAAAASLQRGIIRYRWDTRARQWISNTFILPAAGAYSIGVYESYFTLATYFKATNQVSLSLQHLDNVSGTWSNTNLDSLGPVLWKDDFPKLSWSNSGSLAVATYLISEDTKNETVTYGVRLYTWNREFQQVVRTDLPVETRKRSSLEPFVISFASRSLVGNVGRLRRYNGNAWVAGSLGSFDSGEQPAGFAYADDLALGANDNSARAVSYDPYSGNFLPQVTIQGLGGPIQPTISGLYVTVRRNIFYRDPKGALIQVGTLPAGADQVANHGPFYFAYQLSTGESFVHLMTNGVLAPSAVRTNERMFPAERGDGTILTSINAFAAYTGTSFDTATTIVLHRLLFGEFKGDITGRVVTAATVVDNMGQPLRTGFDYPGEATTGVYGLVNQFSRSRSTVSSSEVSAPDGYTETDFYNGLSQSSIAAAEPYALLSGIEKAKRFFNSANELVQEASYDWAAVSSIKNLATGASENLFGAYTRRERIVSRIYAPGSATPGPLERIQEFEYDPALGLAKTSRTHSFNSEDRRETIEEHTRFAYEEYPDLLAAHVWSPSIEKRTTVAGSPIEIQTTTWRRDWGSVTGWAPFRLYRARSKDAVFTASDWTNTAVANPNDWWLYDEILVRDQFGNILERRNETHQTSTWIFDTRGRFAVAQFPDSSPGEALYLGFEPYETVAPWLLGGSESRLRAAIVKGDAHTGSNSLRLTGPDALTATTTIPSPDGRTVVLSYWFKTRTQNAGRWTISANGAELAARSVEDSQGIWRFSHLLATLPSGSSPVSVEVRFTPTTGANLMIDDIRFSPAESACEASIYNPLSLQAVAKVQASGATTRSLYGGFGLPALEVAPGEAVTTVSGRYLSRLSNGGVFDQSAPNATILLHPQSWAFYQSFTIGEEWRIGWASASPADWNAREGKLHHSGAASKIYFEQQPEARYYGAAVQVSASGPFTGPVGFVFGNDLSLTWDPTRGAWSFGTVFQPPRSAFNVSWATYNASLDAGRLPDTFPEMFGAAGLPLAGDGVVTKLIDQSAWTITDPAGTVYNLVRDPGVPERICVVLAPRSLVLTIRGAEIILFADGGQAFSTVYDSAITGHIGLIATGEVDFANVAFFTDPQSEWNYQDGAARNVQFQVADEFGFIASATIYDTAGRAAIATMPARLAPAPNKLGTYEPNLASFDWTTFTMSGLVVTQHPDAGGYPYTRTRYENSPLAREVQRGIPGSDFAIIGAAGNTHTTSTQYGINDARLGLTAGRYFSQTIVDPDGITRVTLTDQRGAVVRTGALAALSPERWDVTIYLRDAALNLVRLVTPMGYPVDSTYDFLNATLTQSSKDFTVSRRMYDSVGRLRFEMSGDGAAAVPQYVRFYKYDRQSRIAQQGSFPHAWDNELNQHVDDPTWPTAAPSDSFHYDGIDRGDLLGVGRLTATTSERQVSAAEEVDSFRADQSFFYDQRGRTTRISTRADNFRQTTYELTQFYNNLDGIVKGEIPSFTGGIAERFGKTYDPVGRLTEVSLNDVPVIRYEYDLSGQVSRETWLHNGGSIGGRTLKYNPPGWNTLIDGTGFTESVDYTSGGVGGAGYFNGSPARITTAPRGSNGELVSQYSYDVPGRLNQALVQNNSTTFAYDANGNITQLGSTTLVYDGSDQVKTANEQGQSEAYEYDHDGNLNRATRGVALDLSFDWFRGLPLRASRTIGGETVAADLRYGFRKRRIYRKVTRPGAPDESVLYLRGDGPEPLVEFTGTGRKTIHILGPRGLSVLKIEDETYFVSTDRLGSVRALVNSSGSLVTGYDFTPYGSLLGIPLGQGELTTYRYTGRQLDPSGLYDFRARFYDARLGRFISPDPKMQFPSPYSYAAGSPLLLTDPSGEFVFLFVLIAAAIAEVIDAIVTAVIVGAAVGALVGGVQAVVTIAENGLTGGQAAGVFFGFLGLGAVAGAITGFAGGVVGVATSTVAASATAGSIAGAVAGAATGAAVGAGQAALLGADTRAGAAFGALGGAVSGAVGSFLGGFGKLASVQSSIAAQNTLSLVSGTTAGASGSLLSSVAQGKDAKDTLLLTLKGAAYGFLGKVVQLKPPAAPEPPRVSPSNASSSSRNSLSSSSSLEDEGVISI